MSEVRFRTTVFPGNLRCTSCSQGMPQAARDVVLAGVETNIFDLGASRSTSLMLSNMGTYNRLDMLHYFQPVSAAHVE